MTNISITSTFTLGTDTFFSIEWKDGQDFRSEEVCAETLQELIVNRNDIEFSYDEEFEGEDGITIKQAVDNNIASSYATVALEDDGQFDVYQHSIKAYGGDIEVDCGGTYINSFKSEKAAMNKASKLSPMVK